MNRTIYKISKMDCPSEEQLIKMKLQDLEVIKSLEFDIDNRKLVVQHNGNLEKITNLIDELSLDSKMIESKTVLDTGNYEQDISKEKRILWTVLIINFSLFIIEMTTGLISRSMGLVADSLDMFADAAVYGLSLMAVGKTVTRKKSVARLAGYFQLTLAVMGVLEVVRRFVGLEEIPSFETMIIVSILALIANATSLHLLQKSKSNEAHIKASMIFTSNDIIINIGVIVAGILVLLLNSKLPDLVIGSVVFAIVIRGSFRILKLAK